MAGESTTEIFDPPLAEPQVVPFRRRLNAVLAPWFANKGLLSLVDQGVVSGTSFVTGVLIGRTCTKDQLGLFYLVLSIIMFVRGVQDHLISIPYMVCCNRRETSRQAAFTGSVLVFQILFSLAATLAIVFTGFAMTLAGVRSGVQWAVWIVSATLPFFLLRELLRQISFARFYLVAAILFDLGISALQVAGLLWLRQQGTLSAVTAYAAMAVSCGVAIGFWFASRHQPLRLLPEQLASDWSESWYLAKWTLPGALISSASPQITPWLLVTWHGTSATGVLAACATLAGFAQVFLTGVGNILTPRAARAYAAGGKRELYRILGKALIVFSAGIGALCLLFLAMGDTLLVQIFGEPYRGNGMVVTVSVFSVLINAYGNVAGNGLWAIKRPQANFYADLATMMVTLVASAALIPPLGPFGAALAILAGATGAAMIRGITLLRMLAILDEGERLQ